MTYNEENQTIEISKNSREKILLSLSNFKGKDLIDLRVWYHDEKDDEYKPSKKGLSISADKYSELKEAVLKMEEVLSKKE